MQWPLVRAHRTIVSVVLRGGKMKEGGRAPLTSGPRNWYLLEFEHSLYGPGKGAKDVGT